MTTSSSFFADLCCQQIWSSADCQANPEWPLQDPEMWAVLLASEMREKDLYESPTPLLFFNCHESRVALKTAQSLPHANIWSLWSRFCHWPSEVDIVYSHQKLHGLFQYYLDVHMAFYLVCRPPTSKYLWKENVWVFFLLKNPIYTT